MDWIVIEGIKPWDGRYEFDLEGSSFTTREWGWIKRLSGYLPLTIDDGFGGGDPELFSAFATIALVRAGVIDNRQVTDVFDRIIDSPFEATIRIESDEKELEVDKGDNDADPPRPSLSENGNTSGPRSQTSSGKSDDPRSPIGTPGSGTSESRPMPLET